MTDFEVTVVIEVPDELREAIPVALARAGYLYPEAQFRKSRGSIIASANTPKTEEMLKKEILYLLYREHIRSKFEPFRRTALKRLYGDKT